MTTQTTATPGQTELKPIAQQLEILRGALPHLQAVNETVSTDTVPHDAYSYIASPIWRKVARTYGDALQIMLTVILPVHWRHTYVRAYYGHLPSDTCGSATTFCEW